MRKQTEERRLDEQKITPGPPLRASLRCRLDRGRGLSSFGPCSNLGAHECATLAALALSLLCAEKFRSVGCSFRSIPADIGNAAPRRFYGRYDRDSPGRWERRQPRP